jgi:hypothetical protein
VVAGVVAVSVQTQLGMYLGVRKQGEALRRDAWCAQNRKQNMNLGTSSMSPHPDSEL